MFVHFFPLKPAIRFVVSSKSWGFSRCCFFFCTLIIPTVFCSQAFPQAPNDSTPARDPAAVTLVTSALTAMGGSAGWSDLHGAITAGSLIRNGEASGTAFTWSDEWSGEALMRRDNIPPNGAQHSIYLQDASSKGSPLATPSQTAKNTDLRRPRFDNVTALIVHLPGAALNIALQKPAYAITTIAPTQSTPPNTSCVRIRKTPATSATRVDEVSVCFSGDTGLPARAYVPLPNLFHPNQRRLVQVIEYKQFQQIGPVLVPQQVLMTNQGQQPKTITITSATWNPSFTDRTFSGVSQ